jgi:hypothetical protein
MRRLILSSSSALLLVLAASACWADGTVPWDFTIIPTSGGAAPGGTIQYSYDITNHSTTESLYINGFGYAYLSTNVAESGLDLTSFPFTVPPGGSHSDTFFHITWTSTAPVGYSFSRTGWARTNTPGALPAFQSTDE